MSRVDRFVFTPFQENTYILHDDSGECVIIDPGCTTASEQQELRQFIESNSLEPVKLLNTHCHVDHIGGNKFVKDTYDIPLYMHKEEEEVMERSGEMSSMFGFQITPSPEPDHFLAEGDQVRFGNTVLNVLFTPGHSPGSISFYNADRQYVISGDVLFMRSIGRYDLPGGDLDTLLQSIREKLLTLDDEVTVYPGHGPETTIGFEKENNPFLNEAGI